MVMTLDKYFNRPVLKLNNYNIRALFDTGAVVPVWSSSELNLKRKFHARKVKDNVSISGIGRTFGILYRIPKFEFGDLIFEELPIIVCNSMNENDFQMILSASMFYNLTYEINDKVKYLNITIPQDESRVRHLTIKDSKGNVHILCNS